MEFSFADLFAGIGGFHAALKPLGGISVFISEIDKNAAEIYELNWMSRHSAAGLSVSGDIRPLTEGPKILVPKHDVLTAGFPCQPFSKSGFQQGVNEARGTLFFNILKAIEKGQPKLVLLENVRNLVGPRHVSDYHRMIALLRERGYAVSEIPTILSPHEIPLKMGGTPQHRERVFIGAIRTGSKQANQLRHMNSLLPRRPFREATVKWNMKDHLRTEIRLPQKEGANLRIGSQQERALEIWEEFVQSFRHSHPGDLLPGMPLWTEFWKPRRSIRISREVPAWKRQFIEKNSTFYEENRRWIDPWRKKNQLQELIPSFQKFEWQARNQKSLFDCLVQFRPSGIRVKEPTYAPAFVAMSQTPVLGWERRELSETEALALQGFPKSFSFGNQRRSLSLKQVGNAVHPGVAQVVFKALVLRAAELEQPWILEQNRDALKLKEFSSQFQKPLF